MKKIPAFPRARKPKSSILYVYRCAYCGKTFVRVAPGAVFGPHKDRNGFPCGGVPVLETTKMRPLV